MGSRGTATLTRLWLEIRLIGRGGNTKNTTVTRSFLQQGFLVISRAASDPLFFSTGMLRSLGQKDVGRREFWGNVKGDLGARLGNGGEVVIVILLVGSDGKAGAEKFTCQILEGRDRERNNGDGDHKILASIRQAAVISCGDLLCVNVRESRQHGEQERRGWWRETSLQSQY